MIYQTESLTYSDSESNIESEYNYDSTTDNNYPELIDISKEQINKLYELKLLELELEIECIEYYRNIKNTDNNFYIIFNNFINEGGAFLDEFIDYLKDL